MDKGGAKVERGYPGPTQGNTKRKMHAGCMKFYIITSKQHAAISAYESI